MESSIENPCVSGSRGRKWMTCRERSERVREVCCFISPLPSPPQSLLPQSPGNSIAVAGAYSSRQALSGPWNSLTVVSWTYGPQIMGKYPLIVSLFIPLPRGPGGRNYMKKYMAMQRNESLVFIIRGALGVKKHQGDPGMERPQRDSLLKLYMIPWVFPWEIYA